MARRATTPKHLKMEDVITGIQRALETAYFWEKDRDQLKSDSVMSEFLRWSVAARRAHFSRWLSKEKEEMERRLYAALKELAEKYIGPFLKRDMKSKRVLDARRRDLILALADFEQREEIAKDLFGFLKELESRGDPRRKPTQPQKIAQQFIKEKYAAPDEKTQRKLAPVTEVAELSHFISIEFIEFVLRSVWRLENARSRFIAELICKEVKEIQETKDKAAEAALRKFQRRKKEKALSSED
jgi:hypothetical protein